MNGKNSIHGKKLYGTATVGTKGQIVIPANARVELSIETGDRLYVLGSPESGFLGLIKEDALEQIIEHLTEQVQNFRTLKQDNKE
jgi:AbrB family looped-hinge helix DNA binding protein